MTVSDTHADTIREADAAVALKCALMSSLAVTGPLYTHEMYDDGMAALDALVAEVKRERVRADRAEATLRGLEAALCGLMDALVIDEEGSLVTPMNGWASAWVEAQDALSAGSGGLDAEVAQNARAGVGSDFDSGGGGSEPPSASSAAGSGGREEEG